MTKQGKVELGRQFRRKTCAAFCGCIIGLSNVAAQTADTAILGTVTDPAGAVIVGATVTATQPEIGISRETIHGVFAPPDGRVPCNPYTKWLRGRLILQCTRRNNVFVGQF